MKYYTTYVYGVTDEYTRSYDSMYIQNVVGVRMLLHIVGVFFSLQMR